MSVQRDRILLVEDSRTQALQLISSLRDAGWDITHAQSAEEALELLERDTPRLILIDYYLPGTRGDALCRQIRMRIDTHMVPIVILTDDSGRQTELRGLESGADDFIAKSAAKEVLLMRLRALLAKSQQLSASAVVPETGFQKARLLAVDDSQTYLAFLVAQLTSETPCIETVSSGKEAIDRLALEHFDCVLVDLVMPGIDGIEVCRRINELRSTSGKSTMVLMLTGKEDNESLAKALEAGADDFVGKSSDIIVIKGRIRALLRRKFYEEEHRRRLSAELRAKEIEAEHERMQKRTAELAARTHLLSGILAHIPHCVFWKDRDSVYLGCNDNFASEAGVSSPEQIVGKTDHDLPWALGQAEEIRATDREVMKSGLPVVNREMPSLRGDGGQGWMLLSRAPLRDDRGEVVGVLGLHIDITQQKSVEVELRRARDEALAATRARSAFLANMSHELRTPLNGVTGMIGLLLDTELTPQQRRLAKLSKSSGDVLLSLINDILDFSKIEAGKLEISPSDFDLHGAVEDVMDMLAQRAASKGIELACHVHPRVPRRVRGDRDRLKQIITNLLSNAVKFTQHGEIIVRATLEDGDSNPVVVRVTVSDTGIGIAPDRLDRLFKAFSQADASTTRVYGGTGLGLAITKQLTELMGGKVGVESEPGKGSTFWFTVPVEDCCTNSGIAPLSSFNGPDPQFPRVLVVDDNQVQRRILHEQLGSLEIQAATATDGEDALRALREAAAAGTPFHVVIIDCAVPDMDGFALAKTINSHNDLGAVGLLALLPVESTWDLGQLTAMGFAGHIIKPVRQSQLLSTISDAMKADKRGPTALPLIKSTQQVAPPAKDLSGEGLHVLIAEDNEVNQVVTGELLRKMGYRFEVVSNGKAAVEAALTRQFQLVLMDCQMPVMDGLEATRLIREDERAHGRVDRADRVPIIALTANAMKGDREKCLSAGMDAYVCKPIDPVELFRTIDSCLASTKSLRNAA